MRSIPSGTKVERLKKTLWLNWFTNLVYQKYSYLLEIQIFDIKSQVLLLNYEFTATKIQNFLMGRKWTHSNTSKIDLFISEYSVDSTKPRENLSTVVRSLLVFSPFCLPKPKTVISALPI